LPSFYVVPYGGRRSAPLMLAALAGLVHHRQRAHGDKQNRDEDNEYQRATHQLPSRIHG
jgi:hypothetical protein